MANRRPSLVLNAARAVAPNTLLCVRVKRGAAVREADLAVGWQTSLAALSAEIEGHSLGGGMLKLEPGEAVNVLMPHLSPPPQKGELRALLGELHALARGGVDEETLDLGDREILRRRMGLSARQCALLRKGHTLLLERRRNR